MPFKIAFPTTIWFYKYSMHIVTCVVKIVFITDILGRNHFSKLHRIYWRKIFIFEFCTIPVGLWYSPCFLVFFFFSLCFFPVFFPLPSSRPFSLNDCCLAPEIPRLYPCSVQYFLDGVFSRTFIGNPTHSFTTHARGCLFLRDFRHDRWPSGPWGA